MITRIEARGFRCLRHISQELGEFQVLVGPNASGKSTFLDVLAFLNRLVVDGVDQAVAERGSIHDLLWGREGDRFELAIEATVPQEVRRPLHLFAGGSAEAIRYEVAVGLDATGAARILDERVLLTSKEARAASAPTAGDRETLFTPCSDPYWSSLDEETASSTEHALCPEVANPARPDEEPYQIIYRPSGKRPIFGSLSQVEFPTAIWLESVLRSNVIRVNLQPEALRVPAKPGQGDAFCGTGANFPWLVEVLARRKPEVFRDWLGHVQTALRDVSGVRVVERPEDRHRYLMVQYTNGLEVPSWALSEGTLCLLALTFLAYWSQPGCIYLIEEPESHIHPLNLEPIIQSLSSVYDGQVLISTHSPSVLSMLELPQVLVFGRDPEAGVAIVRGQDHPRLRDWKREVSLGTLFGSGVLG
jgi:predicted ATPase